MQIRNPTLFDIAALPLVGPKGRTLFTVILKGTFALGTGEPSDEQMLIAYADELRDDTGAVRYESDIVPFKPRTDIALWAAAYAPDAQPAASVRVSVKVGPVEKPLMVFGERYWNHTGLLRRDYRITEAKPFVRQPIVYEAAFGGIDMLSGAYCSENLMGCGFYDAKAKQNLVGKPLPCIEDPRHLIRSITDRPRPVGYGFYHRAWQPRAAFAGTYDETWRTQRCPLPPEDFDARFYNGAHPDLQVGGYLRGDEPVILTHLTPDGLAHFTLPGIAPICSIARQNEKGRLEEKQGQMHLDTLFIEPDDERYCIVWRTTFPIQSVPEEEIERVAILIDKW